MIESLAELAVADPDEAVKVVQCAMGKAMTWMVMREVEEQVKKVMSV